MLEAVKNDVKFENLNFACRQRQLKDVRQVNRQDASGAKSGKGQRRRSMAVVTKSNDRTLAASYGRPALRDSKLVSAAASS